MPIGLVQNVNIHLLSACTATEGVSIIRTSSNRAVKGGCFALRMHGYTRQSEQLAKGAEKEKQIFSSCGQEGKSHQAAKSRSSFPYIAANKLTNFKNRV